MDEPPANQARHPSPLRWAGAGMIGGASIIGMLWSILGRAPLPLEATPAGSAPVALAQPTPSTGSHVQAESRIDPPSGPSASALVAPPIAPSITSAFASAADPSDPSDPTDRPAASTQAEATEPAPPPTRSVRAVLTERLDINTATQAELELLPNIGPTLATRIIAFREAEGPIRSLTHLTDVRGIGVRTAEAIEPYVRFE